MLKDFSTARSSRVERAVEGPLAEHPNVLHSHHVIIVLERGVSRKNHGWLSHGASLIVGNMGNGLLGDFPGGACRGWLTVEMGSEHVLRAVCRPHLSPLPGPISDGSDKNPNPRLVGCLAVCQSGLACGHLFNKQKVWWFSLFKSLLWLGDRFPSTSGVKRLSWGCAN